jgi:shikimate dehydrogenase
LVRELLSTNNFAGLNVTIPYKESIIPYLDDVTGVAATIGAVNTIVFRNGRTIGYNTDVVGFEASLTDLLKGSRPSALMFGTGGASKAVSAVLKTMGVECTLVSRSQAPHSITWGDLTPEIVQSNRLLINCTPVGMYPHDSECLDIPYEALTPEHFAFDLIYNPSPTRFLEKCAERGTQIKGGREMLELQADESWRLWNQD